MASVLNWPAYRASSDLLTDGVQQQLARWNRERLSPRLPDADWRLTANRDQQMLAMEGEFIDMLRDDVAEEAAEVPSEPGAFVAWFEELKENGPGQGDPLFPWLAERASLDQMRWYLRQEAAGEAGFDDLTAYTQVKMPQRI